MTTPTPRDAPTRRTFLGAVGATAGVALAGCMGIAADDDPMRLPPPENYDALVEADLAYPIYGEDLPEATITDALTGDPVSTRGFVGERHVLMTFVYTRCGTICPALTANLVQAQAAAAKGGYADRVAFLAVTFDPEHDTSSVLRRYGEDRGADYDAGNWYFLRPETPADAKTVVQGTFGDAYHPAESMPYVHNSLVLLANRDGYVERAYANEPPNPRTVVDDLERVVGV